VEDLVDHASRVVGLIPAAGAGTRLGRLPFSKQLYPIGFHRDGAVPGVRVKVVSHYLLERMRAAGIQKAYVVIRHGQWDIPEYFGDGRIAGVRLAYLPIGQTPNAPCSLDAAYPFTGGAIVALGFPDILFRPADVFTRTLAHQRSGGADVVLSLIPAERPADTDMVEVDERGAVRDIVVRPAKTHLRYTWATAVWAASFSRFLHEYVAGDGKTDSRRPSDRELFVGDVVRAAAQSGLRVEGVAFSQGAFLDIGTPRDLARAMQSVAEFDEPGAP
jgi:glucose-1-phosphate thymidylyltransferase